MAKRHASILGTIGRIPVMRINRLAPPEVSLAMLPDTAERYLSTPLFADIGADMNEEELVISRSTTGRPPMT
jgi:hypothetical protein